MRAVGCAGVGVLVLANPPVAHAGNGMYPTGFGAVSSGMSGADVAVTDDTMSFATNPAGLAQISGAQLDAYLTVFNTLRTGHRDRYGNDDPMSNDWAGITGIGFAQRIEGPSFVAGVGLFVQGGLGYVFEDMNTTFGTRDELSFLLSIAKITPGFAWQVTDDLSIGLAAGVNYATARQKFFYETSVMDPDNPEGSFFGMRSDDLSAWGLGVRMGAQYEISDALTLGLSYSSPTSLDLDGGTVTVNYDAADAGRVRYETASLDGFGLPAEASIAVAWRPDDAFLISAEVTWFAWDDAIDQVTLKASNPNTPAPVDSLTLSTAVELRQQWVYALGAEWALDSQMVMRAGYAYGKRSQPAHTLAPTMPLIAEHDLSFGMGYRVDERWEVNLAVEFQPYTSVRYTNEQLPFGESAKESNEVIQGHVTLTRRWQ
jgi:long-chain fatty acid transport protein